MEQYHIITKSLIVKPKDQKIFSDMATEISIEDEAAGEFIVLKQHAKYGESPEIRIDPCEWSIICRAVEDQLEQIKEMNEGV
jgi:hypothetical protein